VALGAGIVAGSVALVAFGFDSLIELAAGTVVIWLFTGGRGSSHSAERRAQMLIATSYALLVVYILITALRDLTGGNRAAVSWVGIGLAVVAAVTMPLLARAKRNVARQLNSSATASEAGQNMICAYLAIALLAGLLANALLGWWWADPVAALVIATVAARESVRAERGESCEEC
jgi:divalent metal cation (Fe/Co/Zn/Cd) transporter